MYISFYIDEMFYSGTATDIKKEKEVQYLVDLNDSNKEPVQFHIRMSTDDGEWTSDDAVAHDLVLAAGAEIERDDNEYAGEPLSPGIYYSSERTAGAKPIFENGEITNEPDDVDERSENEAAG